MRLLCEKCQKEMTYYTEYESRDKMPKKIEMHQCQNEKCKECGVVFHYQISGNRAVYMGTGRTPGIY